MKYIMKYNLIIIKIMAFIALFITIIEIKKTYAVFFSQMHGTSQNNLAIWEIKINNENISSGLNSTFNITNFNVDSNVNIKKGRIAPGTCGNFDIVIDPTDTQVSIRYDITIDSSALTLNNVYLVSVNQISDNTIKLIRTAANTYTAVIPLNKITGSYVNDIRINFAWTNDENNNANDTLIGNIPNNIINIPINVSVTQYVGENIVQYTEE